MKENIKNVIWAINNKYVLMSETEVRSWKAYLVITFVAGFAAALVWAAYVSWYRPGEAEETIASLHAHSAVGFHRAGESYNTDIVLNTIGKNIVAVQALLSYDPNTIEVLSVNTSTTAFNLDVKKTVDNSSGKVFLALAKSTPGINSSNEKIATLSARAKKDFLEPGYSLTFSPMGPVAENCAAILDDGLGTNILGRVYYDYPLVSPPAVSITSPVANATLTGSVLVTADAQSELGISSVEFFVDGVSQATDNTSPYNFNWDTAKFANGNRILTAKACDIFSRCTNSAGVTVSVNNPVSDTTPPTISIASPENGLTVSGTVSITVTASDNVGVTAIEFLIDGASISTDSSLPYSYNWDTTTVSDGFHNLTAKACDAAKNCATSDTVSVNVNNGDHTPPVISNVNLSNITNKSVVVTWSTDERSTSQVSYGTDTTYNKSTPINTNLVTDHRVVVRGLKPNVAYHLVVLSADGSGNKTQSSDYSFTTLASSRK